MCELRQVMKFFVWSKQKKNILKQIGYFSLGWSAKQKKISAKHGENKCILFYAHEKQTKIIEIAKGGQEEDSCFAHFCDCQN